MKDNKIRKTFDENINFFKDASREYYSQKYGEPDPLDKSFMEEKPNHRIIVMRKACAIAACFVTLIGATFIGESLFMDNDAYAGKGVLHRLYNSVMGLGTDEHDNLDNESEEILEITDLKNIDDAVDMCEDLYLPKYIPEGYEFKKLTVTKNVVGVTAEYIYEDDVDKEINIVLGFMHDGDNSSYGTSGEGEEIKLDDRVLYVFDDGEGVSMFTEEGMFGLYGDIAQQELIDIAKGLAKIK